MLVASNRYLTGRLFYSKDWILSRTLRRTTLRFCPILSHPIDGWLHIRPEVRTSLPIHVGMLVNFRPDYPPPSRIPDTQSTLDCLDKREMFHEAPLLIRCLRIFLGGDLIPV